MSRRRDNRVAVVQFLYMWEINPSGELKEEINGFLQSLQGDLDYYRFAEELIWGGIERRDKIDAVIKEHAQNWDFNRIAKIDLSILRLAIYEMLYRDDIPPIVTINEAIELSKLFSIEDAKRFINGILDEFKLKLQRPLREATR
ncbi:MAG: Transcription antitermination protein NusB [Candidatus Moanabacter tarae]|uniref:Transcription antitermination protein NusB n=1 Tax=Candidatus Moanibacter tarae TaxID=2200854 RepID=A0A2Z4AG69_9BACT|nr:MAG: Transcription antitermination protein NusB [Candidatus Moanabacter tarae]|tara:strand:+ start:9675 stop:10106 length:432 start_codon:yes stop_codon:yes gene_type:complete